MEQSFDLDGFVKALTDKGYTGYFHTEGAYPGKLKESISEYLEACRNNQDTLKPELRLSGYVEWRGEDKANVQCAMHITQVKGKFALTNMTISKLDRYGQLLAHVEIPGISLGTLPEKSKALAMVSLSLIHI